MDAGQSLSGAPVELGEFTAGEDPAVVLTGHGAHWSIGASPGVERRIKRSIGREPGQIAMSAGGGGKFSADIGAGHVQAGVGRSEIAAGQIINATGDFRGDHGLLSGGSVGRADAADGIA